MCICVCGKEGRRMGEGKWERKKKSDGKKEKWREVALRREDYALLQTNGRQLRAICHIYTYIYIGAVASLSTIARPFLVFVAVFEVLDPHPRGPYIDRRVIVSAQRPERRCSKG